MRFLSRLLRREISLRHVGDYRELSDDRKALLAEIKRRDSMGDNDGAIRWALRAMEEDPSSFFAAHALATCLALAERDPEARVAAAKAVELRPDLIENHCLMGQICIKLQDITTAKQHFDAAQRIANNEDYDQILVGLADCALMEKDYSYALTLYDKVLKGLEAWPIDKRKQSGCYFSVYMQSGKALARLKRYDESLRRLQAAKNLDPSAGFIDQLICTVQHWAREGT